MSLLLGALTLGFIFAFIALGVYISFRIFDFPDITADGSSTLGAALSAVLLVHKVNPLLATAAAFAGGFLAGTLTGTLATKFKINGLLAGRSEEHTSELQSLRHLVCRLLLEKK